MSPLLRNKTAIITGGSRGIGFAIAQKLISEGARVVICSRTRKELTKALDSLNKQSLKRSLRSRYKQSLKRSLAFGTICDVSKLSDCKKLIKFAKKKLKKIDILINNAGIYGPIGPFEKTDLKNWRQAIDINLMGMVYCSNLVIPEMIKNGRGKIINLCGAGAGSNKTMPNFTSYFTSKFAVAGFSEVLADEFKGKNIQVNSISPGAVKTFLNEYLIKQGPEKSGWQMYEQALKQKKEGGTPPEIPAKLIVYLASDEANHISGRLLSAKWNPPEKLKKIRNFSQNLFKMRRIDRELFYEKK